MKNSRDILAGMVVANEGNWNKVYECIQNRQYPEAEVNGQYITILDDNYPDRLKEAYKPPFVLFYKGNINLLQNNDIIALGIDNVKAQPFRALEKMVLKYKHHFIVDSSKVWNGLVQTTKEMVVVADKGIDLLEQPLVDEIVNNGGVVISEIPFGMNGECDTSRIMSGIEQKLLVVNCENQRLAVRQVVNSLQNGHDIFVIPTTLEEGEDTINNKLISEGGIIFYTPEQLTA